MNTTHTLTLRAYTPAEIAREMAKLSNRVAELENALRHIATEDYQHPTAAAWMHESARAALAKVQK